MIATIARKEWRELARDGRMRITAIAVAVIALAALVAGAQKQSVFTKEQREAQARSREQFEHQGEKGMHMAAHFGLHLNEPHGPLALLDPGLTPYLGRSVWIEAHNQNPMKYRPIEDAPALARFGDLTAALVLQQLVPLLLIALGYTAFAGERDRGTLRALLATNVPRHTLLIGKGLGVVAAASLVLAPVALAGCATVLLLSDTPADTAMRLMVFALAYVVYYTIILALTFVVSAIAKNSRAALTTCLSLWVAGTLLVPKLAADLSERLHPTPLSSTFWANIDRELKTGVNGHDPDAPEVKAIEAATLAQYGVARIEDLPVNFDGIILQAGEDDGNAVFDRHYGPLFDTYDAQARSHAAFGVVAPLLALRSVSTALAETDVTHHRAFASSAETYRRLVERKFNDLITNGKKDGGWESHADDSVWSQIPRFTYEQASFATTLATQRLPLATLCGWLVLAVGGALIALRRVTP